MRTAGRKRIPRIFSHAERPRKKDRARRNLEEDLRRTSVGIYSYCIEKMSLAVSPVATQGVPTLGAPHVFRNLGNSQPLVTQGSQKLFSNELSLSKLYGLDPVYDKFLNSPEYNEISIERDRKVSKEVEELLKPTFKDFFERAAVKLENDTALTPIEKKLLKKKLQSEIFGHLLEDTKKN